MLGSIFICACCVLTSVRSFGDTEGKPWIKAAIGALAVDVPKAFVAVLEEQLDKESLWNEFQRYKKSYGKLYPSDAEEKLRFQNFATNQAIAAIQQQTEQGTARYGVTQFSDLTREEFTKRYMSANPSARPASPAAKQEQILKMPSSIDWRKKGAVTYVKNQGETGSSVPFGYATNIEGRHFLTAGHLVGVSIKQLCECPMVHNQCRKNDLEGSKQQKPDIASCSLFNGTELWCTTLILSKDEKELAKWVAANGPSYAELNALTLMTYVGGIAHPSKNECNPDEINHAVGIVGYGSDAGMPFWIAKNSWGDNWGEEGYFRMYRGDGTCGINSNGRSAVLTKRC